MRVSAKEHGRAPPRPDERECRGKVVSEQQYHRRIEGAYSSAECRIPHSPEAIRPRLSTRVRNELMLVTVKEWNIPPDRPLEFRVSSIGYAEIPQVEYSEIDVGLPSKLAK